MMTNLFSIFDPATSLYMNLNWSSIMISMLIIPMSYWILPTRATTMKSSLMSLLCHELKVALLQHSKMVLPFLAIFIIVLLNNLLGLLPYVFTATSHLVLSMGLALSMWLSFIIFSFNTNLISSLAHFVPSGTPTNLLLFMSLIELVSSLIRPITLAIRLSANMIAGHLLLSLLSGLGPFISTSVMPIFMIPQLMLLLLESAVAVIQSYVFTILVALYISEV